MEKLSGDARAPESRGVATAETSARGAGAGARPGRRGPRCPAEPAGRAQGVWAPRCPAKPAGRAPREGGAAAALPSGSTPPAPGASRHGTGPSTTFGRHPPTMASRAKIKPQVDGLRFSRNTGYGRGVGVKRSRWAGFVAAASQAADRGRPEVSKQAICK